VLSSVRNKFSFRSRTLIHGAVSSFRLAGVFSDLTPAAGGEVPDGCWRLASARPSLRFYSASTHLLIQLVANSWPNCDGMYCSSPGDTRAQLLGWGLGGVVRAHGLQLGNGLIRALVPTNLGWAGEVSAVGVREGGGINKLIFPPSSINRNLVFLQLLKPFLLRPKQF